jgi:hypothetical protein
LSFRITIPSPKDLPTDTALVLRLEGRLSQADLPILEACLEEIRDRPLTLDLAELRGLDTPAATRLAGLIRAGVAVVAASPFVERLLSQAPSDSPTSRDSANHASDSNGP